MSKRLACGLVLLAAYALPVFAPPAAVPLVPPPPDASLTARVFPGVPGWWVWGRLAALAGGALLAASALRRTPPDPLPVSAAPVTTDRWSERGLWGVAIVAILQAVWALRAPQMAKPEQMAFIVSLLLPALLSIACRRSERAATGPSGVGGAILVAVVWAVLWLPVAWRSPSIASLVDGSGVLGALVRSRAPDYNFLADTIRPGQSALYLLFQGGGFIDWFDVTPTIAFVQVVHGLCVAACGVLVGWTAGRIVGPRTAAVATATLLAGPFVLVETLFAGPLYIGQLLGAALPLCCLAIHQRRSAVATVAAGLVTGLMATFPSLMSLAWPGLLCAIVLARRAPRVPTPAIVAALASFAACIAPVTPSLRGLPDLFAFYNSGTVEWATMQNGFFGQLDPDYVRFQGQAGMAHPFDALIGSLLFPFAAPRTGLRLWGDVLVEPVSAALAALGLAACLRRPSWTALGLLATLVLSTAIGGLSTYDRASLMRLPAAPVAVALLAAVGFGALVARLPASRATRLVPGATAVAIVVCGWFLMAMVNPRILPRSATGIAIETMSASDVAAAVVLLPYGWDPQSSPLYLDQLPPAPVRWIGYRNAGDLAAPDGVNDATLLFWSPGVEERADVAASVCARWPSARFYVLRDAAGLSVAFAATTDGRAWVPQVPPERWSTQRCPAALPTERRAADEALASAHDLRDGGRPLDALAVLERAARASVLQVELFRQLAETLLATDSRDATAEEAAFWARRAVTASGYCLPGPVATLRRAYVALHRPEAVAALEATERTARATTCANLAPDHPIRRLDPTTAGNGAPQ